MIARTAALVAALTLTLAGCGADAEEGTAGAGASASPSPSTSPSETADAPASETVEVEEDAEEAPTAAPATGGVLKVKNLRANAPEGWVLSDRMGIQQGAAPPTAFGTLLTVYRFPNSGLYTIDELADAQRASELGRGAKRLDDLEVDGQQVYHLTGRLDAGVRTERFGTIVNDEQVAVEFSFGNDEPKAERDEIIQSVLATVRFG